MRYLFIIIISISIIIIIIINDNESVESELQLKPLQSNGIRFTMLHALLFSLAWMYCIPSQTTWVWIAARTRISNHC